MKLKLLTVYIFGLTFLFATAAERPFVQSSLTSSTVDASGAEIEQDSFRIFYDQHGNLLRTTSATSSSRPLLDYQLGYSDTNFSIYNGPSWSGVDDSVTTSNGVPVYSEHAVFTGTQSSNQSYTCK